MFAQAALDWLTGGSRKPNALGALEERYLADLAAKDAIIADKNRQISHRDEQNNKLFIANMDLAKDNHAKDRELFELREELYENTVDMAELTAELRIMKAARARGNANLKQYQGKVAA